jgi:hypothetical protein
MHGMAAISLESRRWPACLIVVCLQQNCCLGQISSRLAAVSPTHLSPTHSTPATTLQGH